MKVRQIAKRATQMSHMAFRAYDYDPWYPSYIECGRDEAEYWDDEEDDWYETEACKHGVLYCDHCDECDDEVGDIDVCLGCGKYYGTHHGLATWDRHSGVAPQLCHRCWQDQGYPWPGKFAEC